MLPTKRRGKLNLKTETVRNLTAQELSNVGGGMQTVGHYCSTVADSGCCHTGGECDFSHTYCSQSCGNCE